jgi:pyruvate, orthophosphate dikinase
LLVSVRSGAAVSMPGMMETILNLGLNDDTVEGLAAASGNRASPTTRIAASCRCTPTWCSASHPSLRAAAGHEAPHHRRATDARAEADALRSLVKEYQRWCAP